MIRSTMTRELARQKLKLESAALTGHLPRFHLPTQILTHRSCSSSPKTGCHAGCHGNGQKRGATPGATLKIRGSDGERRNGRPLHLVVVSHVTDFLVDVGGVDGARTRGLRRDSQCSNLAKLMNISDFYC